MSDRRDEQDLVTSLAIFDHFPIPVVEQVASEFHPNKFIGYPSMENGRVMERVSIQIPPVPDLDYPGQTYERSCQFCPIGRAMYLNGLYTLENGGYEIVLAGGREVREISVMGIVVDRTVATIIALGTRWAELERLLARYGRPDHIRAHFTNVKKTLEGYYFYRDDRFVDVTDELVLKANTALAQAGLFITNWDAGVISPDDFDAYIAQRKEADA